MKRIAVFGSTGSIGTQTVDIIKKYPELFSLTACFAYKNAQLVKAQADEHGAGYVGLFDADSHSDLKKSYCGKACVIDPTGDLSEVFAQSDIVVVSISGFAGIGVTLSALKCAKTVAIATKEVLVSAGEIVNDYVKKYNGKLIPIDSEHSAIWQCLQGINVGGDYRDHVHRLILTASGGPFRTFEKKDMENVTVEMALKHPNWSMGAKITIDSASMMNKGLEVIEAQRLYNVGVDKIDVLIHPQSIVHSMVECVDGNIIAQLGNADMRHPILYALTYPDRVDTRFGRLDLTKLSGLTFEKPDMEKFSCLALAYEALRMGGIAPCVLNAANERAVELFLAKQIKFTEISTFVHGRMIELCDNNIGDSAGCTLDDIMRADKLARRA
ncbi:MAG: 1-deoxy-D-xylulose-5-phosphate reductoisomerase [Clostridiales bacterium]|nr:1-deoxy-D-xylulose-5-phosphate reductoisomerase [Clostridiales bacterium]